MSLKNWMKKVETSLVNEAQMQTVIVPTVDAPGKPATPGKTTALAFNTTTAAGRTAAAAMGATPGTAATVANPRSPVTAIASPTATTNGGADNTGQQSTQTVGGTTQVSETGLDQVNSFHDEIQVESKPRKEISDGLRYIKDNYKHECKMYEDGWGLDESMYSALVDHYYHEGKIPRKLMIEGGQALREFIEGCYAKDTGMGGNQDAINNGMLDEEDVAEGPAFDKWANDRAASQLHKLNPSSSKENFTMNARRADPRIDSYATDPKPSRLGSAMGKVGNVIQTVGGKVMNRLHPSDEKLRSGPLGPLDEEMSPLERSLRQSTKEKEMFENKKTRSVQEATEKTKTGLRHKADSGGYGRVDDEEDTDEDGKKIKKVKKDEPKKGRGRPKKTDNASGEDKKFDFSAFGVKHGEDIKLKPWDKKKTTVKKIATKADREEVDEAKLKGKQSKLDINKNGKLEKSDFAMLRGKKKKDAQMESWERQLKGLLIEGMPVPVSTSTGQADGGAMSITSEDAGKLLQILQNAGLSVGTENSPVTSPSASPAQVSSNATSPSTGSSGDSAANADLNGSGSAVATMPMPRGMAFSVQPAETEIPTAPPEVNVSDSEDVFNQLGKEHAQSGKSDNGDNALALLKKSIGHSAELVDNKQTPTAEGAKDKSKEEKKKVDESKKSSKPDYEDKDSPYHMGGEYDNVDQDDEDEEDSKEDKKKDKKKDKKEDKKKSEKVDEGKETCNECGGLMEDDHKCETQLNEWSNSPQGQSEDEQFKTELEFMQNIISGGLNKRKVDQTVMPHTRVKIAESKVNGTSDAYTLELKKLAGI
jgi:hypothetical protein